MGALYDELFEYDEPQYGTIYDIADVVYGAAFKSSLFNEDKEGYPLIRIRDLSTYSPQFYTAEEHPKRIFIEPGFVVAGMDAEFVPTFWLGEKAVLNQRVCHFAPPENTAISESYLLFALKPLLAYIQNYASGTTVAHMGKSDLEALKVPLPKEEDLLKFAEVAEPMRKAIVSNAIESKRLAELRDALLPKLMSGEIDVSKIDLTQLNNHFPNSLRQLGDNVERRTNESRHSQLDCRTDAKRAEHKTTSPSSGGNGASHCKERDFRRYRCGWPVPARKRG